MLSGFHAEATVGVQGRQFAIHHIARCELAEQAPHHCKRNAFPSPPASPFSSTSLSSSVIAVFYFTGSPLSPLRMQRSIMPVLGGERRRRRQTHPLRPGWEKGEMKDERHQGAAPTRSPSAGRWIPSPSPPWWNPG